jgi:ankyrin repeat protein
MLLSHGAEILSHVLHKTSAVHIAAGTRYPADSASSNDILRILLEHKESSTSAQINSRASDLLWTPLHFAIVSDKLAAVVLLLKHGANAGIGDKNNRCPLHFAASLGLTEIVRVLIEEGHADVLALDSEGQTPLDHAVANIKPECVQFLKTVQSTQNKEQRTEL